jgi:hypothetical protein
MYRQCSGGVNVELLSRNVKKDYSRGQSPYDQELKPARAESNNKPKLRIHGHPNARPRNTPRPPLVTLDTNAHVPVALP